MTNYVDDQILIGTMASVLDFPSVYMGGPSNYNQRKIAKLLDALAEAGYSLIKSAELKELQDYKFRYESVSK